MKFPSNFIWGTATSAYQVEGNNTNTDWWQWEHNKKRGQKYPLEPSGIACDSYNRYEEDFDLCKNGIYNCSADGSKVVCDNEIITNIPELCNGKDDDCDGIVDETFPNRGQSCTAGLGACMTSGVFVCSANLTTTVCNVQANNTAAKTEICNGIDDDCDGVIDNNCVTSEQAKL